MKHSKVFWAVLDDIWERACKLKLESRRPDYLNAHLNAQTRFANRRGDLSSRRGSDQLIGGRRRGRSGVDAAGRRG